MSSGQMKRDLAAAVMGIAIVVAGGNLVACSLRALTSVRTEIVESVRDVDSVDMSPEDLTAIPREGGLLRVTAADGSCQRSGRLNVYPSADARWVKNIVTVQVMPCP